MSHEFKNIKLSYLNLFGPFGAIASGQHWFRFDLLLMARSHYLNHYLNQSTQWGLLVFTLEQFCQEILKILYLWNVFGNSHLNLHPLSTGVSEWIHMNHEENNKKLIKKYARAGVKYVFVFVFVFKYANICICICICIWKPTRWNICICICIR